MRCRRRSQAPDSLKEFRAPGTGTKTLRAIQALPIPVSALVYSFLTDPRSAREDAAGRRLQQSLLAHSPKRRHRFDNDGRYRSRLPRTAAIRQDQQMLVRFCRWIHRYCDRAGGSGVASQSVRAGPAVLPT